MAKYTFKSNEKEYYHSNKVQFEADDWIQVTEQFVEFLRGCGFIIGYNQIIEQMNDSNNEYIDTVKEE